MLGAAPHVRHRSYFILHSSRTCNLPATVGPGTDTHVSATMAPKGRPQTQTLLAECLLEDGRLLRLFRGATGAICHPYANGGAGPRGTGVRPAASREDRVAHLAKKLNVEASEFPPDFVHTLEQLGARSLFLEHQLAHYRLLWQQSCTSALTLSHRTDLYPRALADASGSGAPQASSSAAGPSGARFWPCARHTRAPDPRPPARTSPALAIARFRPRLLLCANALSRSVC